MPGAQDAAYVPTEHERPPLLPDGHGGFRKPILLLGTTIASTAVRFVLAQGRYYSSLGWDVHIVCSPTQGIEVLRQYEAITVHQIPMSRAMTPLRDLRALIRWIRILRAFNPDVLMSGTPKAGLLGMLAGRWLGVPVRIYHLRGLRLEGLAGLPKHLSRLAERVTSACATQVLIISPSLSERYQELGLVHPDKACVIGRGSSNGVDTDHFRPPNQTERVEARRRWGFSGCDIVIGFVGRFTRDKGILDLAEAVMANHQTQPIKSLFVGGEDADDPLPGIEKWLSKNVPGVRLSGVLPDPRPAYWAMDFLVLPSYREGFGTVVLEASASGLAVVTTTATGCRDSVLPEETGILVDANNVEMITRAISTLASDDELRRALGISGREFVLAHYSQRYVWSQTAQFLARTLSPGSVQKRSKRRLHP